MGYHSEVSIAVNRKPRVALTTALSKLSTALLIPAGTDRVLVKPSVLDPCLVGNTSKEMLRSVVKLFDQMYPVSIVESDNPFRSADEAFEKTGYTELKSESVTLHNLSSSPAESVRMAGHALSEVMMPQLLVRPGGLLVNLATAKTDTDGASPSACIKNLFGLVPRMDKDAYHPVIEMVLLDLLSRFMPCLSIIDMTDIVMGPRHLGRTLHLGGVAVSTDPVALDAFSASMFGIDPMTVPLLKHATELGLGTATLDRIRVVGTDHQKKAMTEAFDQIKHNQKQYIRIS